MPASASKQAEVAARRQRALQLRAAGLTYQGIADQLGYRSKAAACVDVTRALTDGKKMLDTQRDLFTVLELERLDGIERAVQTVIRKASAEGEHSLVLRAADRLVRVSERRAKLLGLDVAPAQAEQAEVSPLDELRARRERKFAGG